MERLLSAVAKTQEKPGRRGPRHSNGQPGREQEYGNAGRTSGEFSREGRQTDAGTQRSSGALRASRVWVRADPTLQQGGPSAPAHCECEAGLWRLLHDGRWEEVVTGIAIGEDAVVDETSDQDPGARRGATLPSPGERCIAGPRFRSTDPSCSLDRAAGCFSPAVTGLLSLRATESRRAPVRSLDPCLLPLESPLSSSDGDDDEISRTLRDRGRYYTTRWICHDVCDTGYLLISIQGFADARVAGA
ncbi:hypothetical protein M432DRAFT_590326 [Thermoascus aurantiacus ATCC 26904]